MARATSYDIQKARDTGYDELQTLASGFLSQAFPLHVVSGGTALSVSQVEFGLIGLRADDVITNVHFVTTASAVSAATDTGQIGIYNSTGTQQASSASTGAITAFTNATKGIQTVALTTPWTVTRHGGYYIALLATMTTTQPSLARANTTAGISTVPTGGARPFAIQTGQASLPASATLAAGTNAYWVGVS